MPDVLSSSETERLRAAPFTYSEVGATYGALPPGYHHLRRTRDIGVGADCFDRAVATVLGWEMHRRAGVSVRASGPVGESAVAVLGIGWGLRVHAPVRVVRLVEDERRRGFVYGTLPGHPERGEEMFVVEIDGDDRVGIAITAFSRPATWLTRSAGPAARIAQRVITRRYLRAVR